MSFNPTAMTSNHATHILDPDGEVVIILRNANASSSPSDEDLQKPSVGNDTDEADVREPTEGENNERGEDDAGEPTGAEQTTGQILGDKEVRIKVSAKHITFASPVFKSLLTGGWKESTTYLEKGSVEILADEWDLQVFLIILHAIHGQYFEVPKKVTLEMLAQIAVIADYYNCKEALYIMTDIWINALDEKIPEVYSPDLIRWVWVSWYFNLSSQFIQSTSTAMTHGNELITAHGLPIPKGIIDSINRRREECIESLVNCLHGTLASFLPAPSLRLFNEFSHPCGCSFECKSIMYGALALQMQSNNVLSPRPAAPFQQLNYGALGQNMRSFKSPIWHAHVQLKPSLFGNTSSQQPSTGFRFVAQDESIRPNSSLFAAPPQQPHTPYIDAPNPDYSSSGKKSWKKPATNVSYGAEEKQHQCPNSNLASSFTHFSNVIPGLLLSQHKAINVQ